MPTRKNKDITRIVNRVNKSSADFVNRLKDPNRLTIPDWEDSRYIATHKLGVGTDDNGQVFIFPYVQNINGKLIDFSNPKFGKWDGMDSAIERKDTVHVDNIQDGLDFTENYKRYYPKGKSFKYGGRRKARLGLEEEIPTQEEYIAQQIAAKRTAAINKSLTRTTPKVPKGIKRGERWNTITKKVEPIYENGNSCAYTFSDNYNQHWDNSEEFRQNHDKYGFKKVDWNDRKSGDAVLVIGNDNIAKHTMMYDSDNSAGQPLYNHSNGGYDESAIRKKAKYPVPLNNKLIYTFVGTPADSTKWINEYKQRYGNQMKCGGRRKAQLGLDIREGGIAIPIAPNMYYMKGRSHDNGGIAIGPNNKNGLEVEGGEVIKVGKNDVKVFSSVPLLRGVSPAQLVMGGANPNKVFNAQEEFKDRNRINDDGTTYETGGQKTININDMPSVFRGQKINGRYVQLGIPPATNKANKLDINFKQRLSSLNDDMKDFIMDGIKYGQQILPKSLRKYYAKGINILNSPGVHDISNAAQKITQVKAMLDEKKAGGIKKFKYGGMIYEINGNVKNGLMNARPKAQYGKKRKVDTYGNFITVDDENYFLNKDNVFVPVEKTIIKKQPKTVRGASTRRDIAYDRQGNRYQRRSDGSLIRVSPEKGNIATNTNLPELVVSANKIDKENINNDTTTINSKVYKSKGNKQYVYDEYGNRFYRRSDGTLLKAGKAQSQSLPELVVTASKPIGKENKDAVESKSYTISGKTENYLTGQRRSANRHPVPDYIGKRPEATNKKESVKASTNSTPRKGNTQTKSVSVVDNGPKVTRSPHAYTNYKGETKIAASPYNNAGILKNITGDSSYDVSQLGSPKYKAAKAKLNTPSTGGGTHPKDGRWVGQYKATNAGDWIGLGSNVLGSLASYFMTKNAINRMPDPVKPVMAQPAKLKTRHNIEPQLTNVREAEQMNRAAVRRNTASSNTSLAREQRLVNESRGARNQLYGQKENIETQLINQDRLNRQSVRMDNVRTYNNYLNRLIATRQSQNQLGISNINNLIYGLTGSVNNIIGNIESRKATNNTIRAIAAANPNVDARLIGGFDYYIDPITKKKYNKNQQYVGTING